MSIRALVTAILLLGALGCTGETSGGGDGDGRGGAGVGGSSGSGGAALGGSSGSSGSGGALGGSGGSSGSGGSGGSNAGAGGTAGSAGMGGAGSGGTGAAGAAGSGGGPAPTTGCGTAATQPFEEWVEGSLEVEGTLRRWWLRLPGNYQPERAYPVIFLFHGCGNENNNVPMQNVIDDNAILVRGVAVEECWDTGRDTADVAFFDAMLAAVSASTCVDSSRLFAAGYSSGSWLINLLECVRGDVLRAAGSVAGGTPYQPECVGSVARIFIHDVDDMDNAIAGNVTERDRLLELNSCDTSAEPVPEEPAPCVRYQGCDAENPVIWCQTGGRQHDRQDNFAPGAFWGLFSAL